MIFKKRAQYVLITLGLAAIVGGAIYFIAHPSKPLVGGTLYDWSRASDERRDVAVQSLIQDHFSSDVIAGQPEKFREYSKLVSDCLTTLAARTEQPRDKKIKDSVSLCVLGVLLKENLDSGGITVKK